MMNNMPATRASSVRQKLRAWRDAGRRQINEADSKEAIALAGLPVPAQGDGPLFVVKYCCDEALHKTELGLVRLHVPASELDTVRRDMHVRAAQAGLQGGTVLVEQQVEGALMEWFVGCRCDSAFGPVIVLGAGGIYAELFGDPVIRMSPIDEVEAAAALRRHKAFAIIDGARGKPRADIGQFAATVAALSQFHWEHRDLIAEIDLNPVIVTPRAAVIADATIVLQA